MKRVPPDPAAFRPWLRSLLAAVLLAVIPILYLLSQQGGGGGRYHEGRRLLLPPAAGAAMVHPRYHFSSYDEYVQLQLRKTADPKLRKLWATRDWRRKVHVFSAVFHRLTREGLLSPGSQALCVGARMGQEVLALREAGVDAIGIDLVPAPPLVVQGDAHSHPFPDAHFDFEFSNAFDHALFPSLFASEIERTLKPGGVALVHALVGARGDKYSANDLDSVDGLASLFRSSDLIYARPIDALGLNMEVAFRKRQEQQRRRRRCVAPKVGEETMALAEPLIEEEPKKPWLTLKRNVAKITYLPDLVDVSNHSRYLYVDVGARDYGSSIGSWFNKRYPKQGQNFSIYAIEADKSFEASYARRRGVTLLPFAAWTHDANLSFAGTGGGDRMGRIVDSAGGGGGVDGGDATLVRGFDFAAWLGTTAGSDDYVVMKMDVEGAEFELVPRLLDTGAICLVDELFLECHYNRWQKCCPGQRSPKYNKTYEDCLSLLRTLRSSGVLVHQWW